jgi:hypothetical protein
MRFDDLDHQPHHGARREELAAFLPFAAREFGRGSIRKSARTGRRWRPPECRRSSSAIACGMVLSVRVRRRIHSFGSTPFSSGLYSSMAFIAVLIALAMSFSSGRFSR